MVTCRRVTVKLRPQTRQPHVEGAIIWNPSETLDFHHRGVTNYSLEESPPPPLRRRVLVPAEARERDMHGPHYEKVTHVEKPVEDGFSGR